MKTKLFHSTLGLILFALIHVSCHTTDPLNVIIVDDYTEPKSELIDLGEDCYIPAFVIIESSKNNPFGMVRIGEANTPDKYRFAALFPNKIGSQYHLNDFVGVRLTKITDEGEVDGLVYVSEMVDLDELRVSQYCDQEYLSKVNYSINLHNATDHDHQSGGPDHSPGHIINMGNPESLTMCMNGEKVSFVEKRVDFYNADGSIDYRDTIMIPDFEKNSTSDFAKTYFAPSNQRLNYTNSKGEKVTRQLYKSLSYFHDHIGEVESSLSALKSNGRCN